ncbi:MAG: hypothetical protein ACLRRT_10905 [Ruthenibacterium lactatiformans]
MSGGPMTEAMYYVLLALHRPAHGYQLMQQIARASRGRVRWARHAVRCADADGKGRADRPV